MAINFQLVQKAVALAARMFLAVRESNKTTAPVVQQSDLVSMIDDVSKQIDAAASNIAGQVAYELEKQQLEKLSAQAKAVKLALEIEHAGMLGATVASISEQIEYSRQRLAEGKHEWFGPWMIAEAVRIEALRLMTGSPRGMVAVEREALNFRLNILNHVGQFVIRADDNPWVHIADFVEGRNEDVLFCLSNMAELRAKDGTLEEVKLDIQGKNPSIDPLASKPLSQQKNKPRPASAPSVIASAAWPFPTASRP